jgi:hypothetical protein
LSLVCTRVASYYRHKKTAADAVFKRVCRI